jgi:hypothetical protein
LAAWAEVESIMHYSAEIERLESVTSDVASKISDKGFIDRFLNVSRNEKERKGFRRGDQMLRAIDEVVPRMENVADGCDKIYSIMIERDIGRRSYK